MGDEPTLYEGDLVVDGWVDTLQLALRRAHGQVEVDGRFGADTRAAVERFQHEQGIDRDGVVGNQTWAALLGRDPEPPGRNNGPHGGLHPPDHHSQATVQPATTPEPAAPVSAPVAAPAAAPVAAPIAAEPYADTPYAQIWEYAFSLGHDHPDDGSDAPDVYDGETRKVWQAAVTAGREAARGSAHTVSTDPVVTPGVGPVVGLPTLRFNAPTVEVAAVTVDTPLAFLVVTGGLQGGDALTVTPPAGAPPLGTSLDQNGFRTEVTSQLEGLFSGIRISGINGGLIPSGSMSIGTTWGNEFVSSEVRMITPTHYLFLGSANFHGDAVPTSWGDAAIHGSVGFSIDLEIFPKPPPVDVPEPEPWYERAWESVEEHAGQVLVGVVVIGAVVVVVTNPELWPAAGAAAAAAD